jgi:hypothetical protein
MREVDWKTSVGTNHACDVPGEARPRARTGALTRASAELGVEVLVQAGRLIVGSRSVVHRT